MKHFILVPLVLLFTLPLFAQLDYKAGFLVVPAKFTFDGKHAYNYQVKELLERESSSAFREYKSGITLKNIGSGLFAASVAAGIVSMGINLGVNYGEYYASPWDLLVLVPATAGIVLNVSGNSRLKRSTEKFNREYYKDVDTGSTLKPAITQNGVGLVLIF